MNLNVRAKIQSGIFITFLASAGFVPKITEADSASSKDPQLVCVDSSITVGERIVWSLHRGTSKSARELSCESEMAARQIFIERDRQYFTQGDVDNNYRTRNTTVDKNYTDRDKLQSNETFKKGWEIDIVRTTTISDSSIQAKQRPASKNLPNGYVEVRK